MKPPFFLLCCFTSILSPILLGAKTSISYNEQIHLDFNEGKLQVFFNENPIIDVQSIQFNYKSPSDIHVISSSEKKLTLALIYPSVVEFAHHATDTQPRTAQLEITRVPGGMRFQTSPDWGKHVTLQFNDLGGHFFGLSEPLQPHNQKSPDLRGAVVDVEVKSDGEGIVENYASAFSAFFMSSQGYGSFFDTFARGRYQFAINGTHQIHHDTGKLDWYLFFGSNGTEILRGYYQLIGEPKSLPLWALGPVPWRDQNNGGAAEILDDMRQFEKLQIPATAWFVDRPYSDGAHEWSEMNFSESFAKPEEWITEIREKHGMEFMTWSATAFFGDQRFNHHLDNWHCYLDLSDPESVSAYQSELANKQYVHGVRGHKMDRADERFSAYSPWTDISVQEPERRNRYVYLFAKIHDEALRAAWGDDQFSFARAAIHRTQPYLSAIWGGDPRSSWEGFQGNFANGIRCGFMGFPVWGSDVGGYLGEGNIPEDLYARWLQAGSMSGLFEIKLDGAGGSGADRVPWHCSTELQDIFRKVCEDRMQMLPTLYSLANHSAYSGVLMQPMAYRHLDDAKTYEIWDQFYLGDSILVAPVFTPENIRQVYLPEGKWHDFDDPMLTYKGGQMITVKAPLNKLPRFIRANSLYLTGAIHAGNTSTWKTIKPYLLIHVFPGVEGESYCFNYIDSERDNTVCPIILNNKAKVIELTLPNLSVETTVQLFTSHSPKEVIWNGQTISYDYDSDAKKLKIILSSKQGILKIEL